MEFQDAITSVVFVGENFPGTFFRASKFSDVLGDVDPSSQLITPVVSQHRFPKDDIRVGITPSRVDIAYGKLDPLPDLLQAVALRVAESIGQIDASTISGVGINLNVTLARGSMKLRGDEYTRQLIGLKDLEKRVQADRIRRTNINFSYAIGEVLYTVYLEPHVKTDGELLHVRLNGHQEVSSKEEIRAALGRYGEIKTYITAFHDRFLN